MLFGTGTSCGFSLYIDSMAAAPVEAAPGGMVSANKGGYETDATASRENVYLLTYSFNQDEGSEGFTDILESWPFCFGEIVL